MGDEEPKIIKKSKFIALSDKNIQNNFKPATEIIMSPREVTKIVVKSKGSTNNANMPQNDIEVIIERCVTPRIGKNRKSDKSENRIETEPNNSFRKDAYGSPIVKTGPKNYKVSFQDQLNQNKLQEIVNVKSFKNSVEESPNIVKENRCYRCLIF
jgi:hypothetical protein